MIDLNDLRHSISTALNLGRYTIVVKQVGGEPVPASITLDLVERDDDLFDTGYPDGRPAWDRWYKVASEDATRAALRPTITPEGEALKPFGSDDHGPAVPQQKYVSPVRGVHDGGLVPGPFKAPEAPRVYEFALQDAVSTFGLTLVATLDVIGLEYAPDQKAAAAADWVHVYDRVTRERRTLKRPEPDAVLSGLRDVAADLRARDAFDRVAMAQNIGGEDAASAIRDQIRQEEGLPELSEVLADPMPPVGPLTSTEGLKAGDVLRFTPDGVLMKVSEDAFKHSFAGEVRCQDIPSDLKGIYPPCQLSFVARPGVWMPWEGGENPVPGMWVRVQTASKGEFDGASEGIEWNIGVEIGYSVTAYMVVDTPPASSDT